MDNNDSFSVRMGIVPPKIMQTDNLDKYARTALYNIFYDMLPTKLSSSKYKQWENSWELIGIGFFKMRKNEGSIILDNGYDDPYLSVGILRKYDELINNGEWNRILDFVEFIYNKILNEKSKKSKFSYRINAAFKKENVGYKLIDGKFSRLIDEQEIESVEKALASPYQNAGNHIKKALGFFSDRQNPDYENSIKESIMAAESIVGEITGEKNFNRAVGKLKDEDIKMHPQFIEAMKNLYNFTSDTDGIRHDTGKKESLQCNHATARYMLVVCSALVNYLTDLKT